VNFAARTIAARTIAARTIAMVLGSALLVSSPAPSARAIGGDQFLSLCSDSADNPDRDFCLGYVFAIAEALNGLPEQTVCIQEASPASLLEATMSHIGAVREPGQKSSGELVVNALEASFPC
jgi:hypothetical protein